MTAPPRYRIHADDGWTSMPMSEHAAIRAQLVLIHADPNQHYAIRPDEPTDPTTDRSTP